MIPIVFQQYGTRGFVEYAIRCARDFGNRVVLIGDENQNKSLCEFFGFDSVWSLPLWLEQSYIHTSQLPRKFELFCFQRWFSLMEWMGQNDVDQVFAADSDVLVYCDITHEAQAFKGYDYTLSSDEHGYCCAGQSFILSADVLSEFCQFCVNAFAKKVKLGNDMTAWTEFRSHTNKRWKNTAQIANRETFDHHMGCFLDRFEAVNRMKRIQFINGLPHCRHLPSGEMIRFKLLHCWGASEQLMPKLYERKSL